MPPTVATAHFPKKAIFPRGIRLNGPPTSRMPLTGLVVRRASITILARMVRISLATLQVAAGPIIPHAHFSGNGLPSLGRGQITCNRAARQDRSASCSAPVPCRRGLQPGFARASSSNLRPTPSRVFPRLCAKASTEIIFAGAGLLHGRPASKEAVEKGARSFSAEAAVGPKRRKRVLRTGNYPHR